MTAVHPVQAARVWPLVLTAAAILLLTQGSRQSLGLFVAPIDQDTGLGVAKISLAFAIGQFTWGLAQPFFGAMAGRWGIRASTSISKPQAGLNAPIAGVNMC
jgi:MFS family permease